MSESHRDELETTSICFLSSGKKPLFSFKSLNLFFSFFFFNLFFSSFVPLVSSFSIDAGFYNEMEAASDFV